MYDKKKLNKNEHLFSLLVEKICTKKEKWSRAIIAPPNFKKKVYLLLFWIFEEVFFFKASLENLQKMLLV